MTDPLRLHDKSSVSPKAESKRFEPWEKLFGWSRGSSSWITSSSAPLGGETQSFFLPTSVLNASTSRETATPCDPILSMLDLPEWYLSLLGASTSQVADLVPQSDQDVAELMKQINTILTPSDTTCYESLAASQQQLEYVSNAFLALLASINRCLMENTRADDGESSSSSRQGLPSSRISFDVPAILAVCHAALSNGRTASVPSTVHESSDTGPSFAPSRLIPLPLRLAATELLMSSIRLCDSGCVSNTVTDTRQGGSAVAASHIIADSKQMKPSDVDRKMFYHLVLQLCPCPTHQSPTTSSAQESSSGLPHAHDTPCPETKVSADPLSPSLNPALSYPALEDVESTVSNVPYRVLRSVQLRALLALTGDGRAIGNLPDLVNQMHSFLKESWSVLSRRRHQASLGYLSDSVPPSEHTLRYDPMSQEERTFSSLLDFFISIVKFNFPKVALSDIERTLLTICAFSDPWPVPAFQGITGTAAESDPQPPLQPPTSPIQAPSPPPRQERSSWGAFSVQSGTGEQNPSSRVAPITLSAIASPPSSIPRPSQPYSTAFSLGTKAPSTPPISSVDESTTKVHPGVGNAALSEVPANVGYPPLSLLRPRELRLILFLFEVGITSKILPPTTVAPTTFLLCRILGYVRLSTIVDDALKADAYKMIQCCLKSQYTNLSLRAVLDRLASTTPPTTGKAFLPDLALILGGLRYITYAAQYIESANSLSETRPNTLLNLALVAPALKSLASLGDNTVDLDMVLLYRSILPIEESNFMLDPRAPSKPSATVKLYADLPCLSPRTALDWQIVFALFHLTYERVQALRQPLLQEALSVSSGANKVFPSLNSQSANTKQTSWLPPRVRPDAKHPVIQEFLALASNCRLSTDLTLSSLSAPLSDSLIPRKADHSAVQGDVEYVIPWSQNWSDLFLRMIWSFPDEKAVRTVQDFYEQGLLLPCFHNWIGNLDALVSSLICRIGSSSRSVGSTPAPKARALLVEVLLDRIYPAVIDFHDLHEALMTDIIIPLSAKVLVEDPDEFLMPKLFEALIVSAVRVTVAQVSPDSTQELPSEGTTKTSASVAEAAGPKPGDAEATNSTVMSGTATRSSSPLFTLIRQLLNKLVRQAKGPKEGRYVFCLHSKNCAEVPVTVHAVSSLIAVFNRISFTVSTFVAGNLGGDTTPLEGGQGGARLGQLDVVRNHATAIFRDIVEIILGTLDTAQGSSAGISWGKTPMEPRLVALQWALRLRTDSQHRLFVISDIDEFIEPHAQLIGRDGTVHIDLDEPGPKVGRTSERGWEDPPLNATRDESRGRSRAEGSTARTREGSRVRVKATPEAQQRTRLHWHLPQRIHFDLPRDAVQSEVVRTYIPPPTLGDMTAEDRPILPLPSSAGTPLPVSELLRAYISLLKNEEDWDLVSYLLAHLPHQLTNRYLFCGLQCEHELQQLRDLLVSQLPPSNSLITHAQLPWHIKRADVVAIAYATLQSLVGYRALFSQAQRDDIARSFINGMGPSNSMALPCIRGLTVSALELPQSFALTLPEALKSLQHVMANPALAVHIIELLILVGHSPIFHNNIGQDEYKRIFSIALEYISCYRSSVNGQSENFAPDVTVVTLGNYIMSQAYHVVALFFSRIRLTDRGNFVPFITESLAEMHAGETLWDEQAVVLLDYITRVTFANAKPRPTQSFINTTLFGTFPVRDPNRPSSTSQQPFLGQHEASVSKTYIYPRSVITISALQRRRWCEAVIRRPSGAFAFLLKVENEDPDPVLQDSEFQDTPELLLANRSGGDRSICLAPHLPIVPDGLTRFGDAYAGRRRALSLGSQARPDENSTFTGFGPTSLCIPPYREGKRTSKAKSGRGSSNKDSGSKSKGKENAKEIYTKEKDGNTSASPYAPRSSGELDNVRAVIEDVLKLGSRSSDADEQMLAVNLVSRHALDPAFIETNLTGYPDVDVRKMPVALSTSNSIVSSALPRLDSASVLESKTISVLFVGPGQSTPNDILANMHGSPAYAHFVARMSCEMVPLGTPEAKMRSTGDLNRDEHGGYMYMWYDDITQVLFHVPTMMPTFMCLPSQEPQFSNKLTPVANDLVHIVWNESGQEYSFGLIPSGLSKYMVNIVISPDARGGVKLGSVSHARGTKSYRVTLQRAQGMPNFSPVGDGLVVSEDELPTFVRTLAISSHSMALIFMAIRRGYTCRTNWVSRLGMIQRLYERAEKSRGPHTQSTGKWAVYEAIANDRF